MKIKKRLFELNLPAGKSAFLWGPGKVGKTYWISHPRNLGNNIQVLPWQMFIEQLCSGELI